MESQPLTEYVTLISSDDYSFVVRRSAACISPAIKRMLDPASMISQFPPIELRTDDICRWFHGVPDQYLSV